MQFMHIVLYFMLVALVHCSSTCAIDDSNTCLPEIKDGYKLECVVVPNEGIQLSVSFNSFNSSCFKI